MKDAVKKAVLSFADRLSETPCSGQVMKIIHFGSHAKGSATSDSDVDILVISSGDGALADVVADVSFRIQSDNGIPIEALIVDLDEVFPIRDYFILNVLRTGMEVYSVSEEDIKREARSHLLLLAEEYLKGAEDSLDAGNIRLALDGAYNAAELAVKSLILAVRDDLPGTHGGLVGAFGNEYVTRGEFDPETGRELNIALQLRAKARYRYQSTIREDEARRVMDLARKVMDGARKRLQ